MGNHAAGDAIAREAAIEFAKLVNQTTKVVGAIPRLDAIEALDNAIGRAKASHGFSPDCEFEATHPRKPDIVHPQVADWTDPHPVSPLGMLMVEAFAPNGLRDLHRYWPANGAIPDDEVSEKEHEEAYDLWDKEVGTPFQNRYALS